MEGLSLEDIVRQLSDLEVALFLCLAAREHCLIETTSDGIHDLAKELALVCKHLLRLEPIQYTYIFSRSAQMTLTCPIPSWIVPRQRPSRTFRMRSSRQALGEIRSVKLIFG
jgi:hypothetical protein